MRGGITQEGNMYLVLSMAYYNLQNFEQSLQALQFASEYSQSKKIASNGKNMSMQSKDNK